MFDNVQNPRVLERLVRDDFSYIFQIFRIFPGLLGITMLPTKGITKIFPDFPDFSDFLGRLQPSEATIQKALGTPGVVPSSHDDLRSLSWTSRIFSFPDSRDLLEVLGGLSRQRERPLGRIP